MANHAIPSSTPLGINKQKSMKRTIVRKHKNKIKKHTKKDLIFNKIISYLLSDSYMYNPLVSPQPTFDFPPPKQIVTPPGSQEDVAYPIKGKKKKLIDKIVDFLEADCYLYSPLISNQHVDSNKSHAASPGNFQTPGVNKSTETQGGKIQHMTQESRDVNGSLRSKPAVMKTVAYHKTVKNIVHQNHRSKSSQGP